jgi:GT2 family glycosyltransferase
LVTSNFAVDKNLFLEMGGFNETFPKAGGEDRELSERIHAAGHAVFFNPDLTVHHHHNLTLISFCRQHFNYGAGAYQHHRAVAQRRKNHKLQIEPSRFYRRLLLTPFKEKNFFVAAGTTTALFLSQAANAAGFFHARFKQKRGKP